MQEQIPQDFHTANARKAFEISYALFWVAKSITNDPIAGYLRDLGLRILWAVTMGEYENAMKYLRSGEYFIRLAGSTGARAPLTGRPQQLQSRSPFT